MFVNKHPLVDIAVNLTDDAFNQDNEAIIERAVKAGVVKIGVTGSDIKDSEQALELAQRFPDILFTTAGIHPHYAKNCNSDWLKQLDSLLKESAVKAIGETGLDFNRNFSPPRQQIEVFEKQLELASETSKPIFMHQRDAHKQFHQMIHHHRDNLTRGLLHCFTGTKEELFACLDLDLYIGVTGWICDERRGFHLLPLLKEVPPNRLMLETDAPYLLPRTIKPKPKSRRNEPANLPHICEFAAQHMGINYEKLAVQTTATAFEFFELGSIEIY